MKKKSFEKKIKFEYYEDNSSHEKNLYKGGPISPENFDDLLIHSYVADNKYQVHIKGSKKSLEELGKYLINLANYNTVDPEYHDHFDQLDNIRGNSELIIHHPSSEWES